MNDAPRLQPLRPIAALVVCSLLAGCGSLFSPSPPISYYTLTPTATADATLPPLTGRIVAVQTARLPDYLHQNGIITRTSTNAISVARDSQWAGALDDNITNVIVTNLARVLATTKVVAFPVSPALPVDRVVQVAISEFEQGPGGEVVLSAQWAVFADGGRSYLATDAGTYATAVSGTGYAGIATAMSQVLAALSHDIAATVAGTGRAPSKPVSGWVP